MSYTDNLNAFVSSLEDSLADIEPSQVKDDPNTYRLIKLLSWGKQAQGATSSGTGDTGGSSDGLTSAQLSTELETLETLASSLLSEIQGKADASETQPVSLNSVPLATNASTSTLQSEQINNFGASADSPATSSTGSFSFISLFKRFLSHLLSRRSSLGLSISNSGDNIILPAPGANIEYVITALRIQSSTSNTSTVLIKKGASDTNSPRLRTVADASGISEVYGFTEAIRCGANNAFIINLSAGNAHSISVIYYTSSTTTGLPV